MIIYLARHGQTTGDIEERYGGDYDDHLTELGKQQAGKLAESLANEQLECLLASPKIRAQETAEILSGKLGLEAETLDDFRERNGYGVLTGLTKAEAKDKYPEIVELLKSPKSTIEGAEDYNLFKQRITSALDVLSSKPFEKVVVVTHGGPIRLIFREILMLGEINIGDCAVAVLQYSDNKYELIESAGIEIL